MRARVDGIAPRWEPRVEVVVIEIDPWYQARFKDRPLEAGGVRSIIVLQGPS